MGSPFANPPCSAAPPRKDAYTPPLKASTLADKYGVEVSTVYQIKSAMEKEGRLDAPAPAAKPHEVTELSDDLPEEFAPEEEESEDEDAGEDDYDPFTYRGKIAGGEL